MGSSSKPTRNPPQRPVRDRRQPPRVPRRRRRRGDRRDVVPAHRQRQAHGANDRPRSPASASAARAAATSSTPPRRRRHRRPVRRRPEDARRARPRSTPRPRSTGLPQDVRRRWARSIDAVTISTPDHIHGIAAATAMQHGQARLLPEAADAVGLRGAAAAQAGDREEGRDADGQPGQRRQRAAPRGRGDPGRRDRAGDASCTSGPTARSGRRASTGPKGEDPVPPDLDWDLWLGPAKDAAVQEGRLPHVQAGAAGRTSAPARWATWRATR